jgi:hypothetical protein
LNNTKTSQNNPEVTKTNVSNPIKKYIKEKLVKFKNTNISKKFDINDILR